MTNETARREWQASERKADAAVSSGCLILDSHDAGLVEEERLGARLSIGSCVLQVSATLNPFLAKTDLLQMPGLVRFLVERNATMLGVYAHVTAPGTIQLGDPVAVEGRGP